MTLFALISFTDGQAVTSLQCKMLIFSAIISLIQIEQPFKVRKQKKLIGSQLIIKMVYETQLEPIAVFCQNEKNAAAIKLKACLSRKQRLTSTRLFLQISLLSVTLWLLNAIRCLIFTIWHFITFLAFQYKVWLLIPCVPFNTLLYQDSCFRRSRWEVTYLKQNQRAMFFKMRYLGWPNFRRKANVWSLKLFNL